MNYVLDREELKEKILNEGKLTLRPSSLQQFLGCPHQWFLSSLMGNFQRPAAAATAGTSLHKGAEMGYSDKIRTGELPPLSFLTDIVSEEWRRLNDEQELVYGKDEDYHSYEKDLIKGMGDYYKDLMPETDPVAVEKRYTIQLDHPVFESLSGTLDIVLERGIVDIKHTKKVTSPAKYTLQQSTYTLLRTASGEVSNFNEIHNIIRGKGTERLSLAPKVDYAKYIVNQILDATEAFLETGNTALFRGTNSHAYFLCNPAWCGYYAGCPHVKDLR